MHLLPLYMAPCTNRHPHLETLQATTYTLEKSKGRSSVQIEFNWKGTATEDLFDSVENEHNSSSVGDTLYDKIYHFFHQPQVVVLMTAAYRTAFCLLFNCLDSTRLLYSTRGIFYFCSTAAVCKPNQCSSVPSHSSFSMHTGGGLSK